MRMDTQFDFSRTDLRFAMIGSGSWATALIKLLLNHQQKIGWYLRNNKKIEQVIEEERNPKYLRSVHLDPLRLKMSSDINEVVSQADVIVFCTPSAYFLDVVDNLNVSLEEKFIISAIKGFVGSKFQTIAEYFHDERGVPFDRIGIISGPSHAEEVGMEKLSYLTLSSKYPEAARSLCDIFRCNYINTMPGTDIYGVEYTAALKNIYAVACGICHALGYGDNFMSVLITNAYHEIAEFLNATHPDPERVLTTSAYLGDLLVTCYSQFSRNRTLGSMIGKGYSVKSAQFEMNMVAEGYYAVKSIYEINKEFRIDMPIAEAVYQILYEERYAPYIIKQLSDILW